jgi:peptide/nickel transport system permease protein
MKMDMSKQENIKEENLNDINKVNNAPEMDELPPGDYPQQALDDTRRVKILSPSLLVAKRFFRNKLAIVGLILLLFMFAFCFLGGWIIPYSQKQVFYKYGKILFDYGTATERVSYENYYLGDDKAVHYSVKHRMNTYITQMNDESKDILLVADTSEDKNEYTVKRCANDIFLLQNETIEEVAIYSNVEFFGSYNSFTKQLEINNVIENEDAFKDSVFDSIQDNSMTFVYSSSTYIVTAGLKNEYKVYQKLPDGIFTYKSGVIGADFETAVKGNLDSATFSLGERNFLIDKKGMGTYEISENKGVQVSLYSSRYVFDKYNVEGPDVPSDFKLAALTAMANNTPAFTVADKNYTVGKDADDGNIVISEIISGVPVEYVKASTFVVRRYNGEDSLSQGFKEQVNTKVKEMDESGTITSDFIYYTELLDEAGNPQVDENGEPIRGEANFSIERKLDSFVLRNFQEKYLIDIYSPPSSTHLLGTDANGMDVLTRMMYGGRISLMIGFVVIFLSMFIGVTLGGIAGYFGKWVDNLIMRIVDVFYCIPSMPILIILGALFDALKLEPLTRIMYLMVILGVLGWAGIARLVRGQILSLREQEFMLATEATGLKASRRIFRHLIPNVMPQLIVNATMGLGGIILTESTLSFLGLGAKYPLATWGAMINSVSSAAAMTQYTYIWIPVGVLICLTVIAFNFVGDGLRDAFDPKMKR